MTWVKIDSGILLYKIAKIQSGKGTKHFYHSLTGLRHAPTSTPGNLRISSALSTCRGITFRHSTTLLWGKCPGVFCQLLLERMQTPSEYLPICELAHLASSQFFLTHDSSPLSEDIRLRCKDDKEREKGMLPFLKIFFVLLCCVVFSNTKSWTQARCHFFKLPSQSWISPCPSWRPRTIACLPELCNYQPPCTLFVPYQPCSEHYG